MSIDPRSLTALLKQQLAPDLNLITGSASSGSAGTGSASAFDSMLSQLISTGQIELAADEDSVNALGSGLPASLQRLQGTSASGFEFLTTETAAAGSPIDSDAQSISSPFNDLIRDAAKRYGIPESLIKGIIGVESSFNPNVQSSAGAKGLMQLMDGTASGLGVANSFDPAQNIEGGTKFFSYLLRKYEGSVPTALAAYNAGPGRLDRLGIHDEQSLTALYGTLPGETQRYVAKVLDKQRSFSL